MMRTTLAQGKAQSFSRDNNKTPTSTSKRLRPANRRGMTSFKECLVSKTLNPKDVFVTLAALALLLFVPAYAAQETTDDDEEIDIIIIDPETF